MHPQQTLLKIRTQEVTYPPHLSPGAVSFMRLALVRDPAQRATMGQLLAHPWVVGLMTRSSGRRAGGVSEGRVSAGRASGVGACAWWAHRVQRQQEGKGGESGGVAGRQSSREAYANGAQGQLLVQRACGSQAAPHSLRQCA
jgi:hypothetical protein